MFQYDFMSQYQNGSGANTKQASRLKEIISVGDLGAHMIEKLLIKFFNQLTVSSVL